MYIHRYLPGSWIHRWHRWTSNVWAVCASECHLCHELSLIHGWACWETRVLMWVTKTKGPLKTPLDLQRVQTPTHVYLGSLPESPLCWRRRYETQRRALKRQGPRICESRREDKHKGERQRAKWVRQSVSGSSQHHISLPKGILPLKKWKSHPFTKLLPRKRKIK